MKVDRLWVQNNLALGVEEKHKTYLLLDRPKILYLVELKKMGILDAYAVAAKDVLRPQAYACGYITLVKVVLD